MKKQTFLKICPKCGSTNIIPCTQLGMIMGEHLLNYCSDCSYGYPQGTTFPEVEQTEIEDFRKEIKKWKK